jgi:hypothetical protein
MRKILILILFFHSNSIAIIAQCTNATINTFDLYFLRTKQSIMNVDTKQRIAYLEDKPSDGYIFDLLTKYPECHRDYLRLHSYYFSDIIYESAIQYLLRINKDPELKKEIGTMLCEKLNDEDMIAYSLIDKFFSASEFNKEEQNLFLEKMRNNIYDTYWIMFCTPLIKNKDDIALIKKTYQYPSSIINDEKKFLYDEGLAAIASILVSLGSEKELNYLLRYFTVTDSDYILKTKQLRYLAHSKNRKAINLILDYYNSVPEVIKERIITEHLSKCILELPKDTTTGKYDIKTVDKWLKKHRKNYKINVNSIQ